MGSSALLDVLQGPWIHDLSVFFSLFLRVSDPYNFQVRASVVLCN